MLLRARGSVLTSYPHPCSDRVLASPPVRLAIDLDETFKTDAHITKQTAYLTTPVGNAEDPPTAAEQRRCNRFAFVRFDRQTIEGEGQRCAAVQLKATWRGTRCRGNR